MKYTHFNVFPFNSILVGRSIIRDGQCNWELILATHLAAASEDLERSLSLSDSFRGISIGRSMKLAPVSPLHCDCGPIHLEFRKIIMPRQIRFEIGMGMGLGMGA